MIRGHFRGVGYPRIVYTDLNGLFCKAFEAELTLVREGHLGGVCALLQAHLRPPSLGTPKSEQGFLLVR
jgi:hypothetical protein